jgi:hypothetical protein
MSSDRRIPEVLRMRVPPKNDSGPLSFLSFKDWLEGEQSETQEWIPIARNWKDSNGDFFTISALASFSDRNLEKLLSTHRWDIEPDFGLPYFGFDVCTNRSEYRDGLHEIVDEIEFRPLVIRLYFHDYVPSRFEIAQTFLLYHEAFLVPEIGEYHRIDDDGQILPVLRIRTEGKNQAILVEHHHLKDYLAANQSCLVRYHDHRRASSEDISSHIENQFQAFPVQGELSRYELWLRTDLGRTIGGSSHSRLLGKDIVRPYDKPARRHTWALTGDKKGRFQKFVIGRDAQGEPVEETCDHEELSNYFTDTGAPHYLTPVYFKREVLKKYYDNPRLYSVEDQYVRCLDLWGIQFDVNDANLVYAWLGDLGRDLPEKEQLHWRQYNVPPEGSITDRRWKTDFCAEFAEPTQSIYRFRQAYDAVQVRFQELFGFELFLKLSEEDAHCHQTLHVPVTDQQKEFDEQIQYLAKILVDSLNKGHLEEQQSGSIEAFQNFLSANFGSQPALEISKSFRMIQELRSSGSAHRKGKKFEKCIRKYGLDNLSIQKRFEVVLDGITGALEMLCQD